MPADSLVDMARRVCMKACRGITDIGDIPYELLRAVLLKIENPEQLHTLEQNSPQIIGKDREIWLSMLKRDIPDYESKPHEPSDPKNWWKVYRKLKKEALQESAAGTERLKAALSSAQEKRGPTTKLISNAQLPRQAVRKRQAITHNYLSGKTGSRGAHSLSLMDRIRKEARGASSAKMNRPTHELQKKSSGVVKAPQSFVRDIKQQSTAKLPLAEAREAMGHAGVQGPKVLPHSTTAQYDLTQDREARLRSLKTGKRVDRKESDRMTHHTTTNVNHLTLDFLEDDDNDGDDKLFRPSIPEGSHSRESPQPSPIKKREASKLFMSGSSLKRKRPSPDIM